MKHRVHWVVRLGATATHGNVGRAAVPDGLRVIGNVERGPQFGLLAASADGRFFQINGDHVTPLSTAQLRRAVSRAQACPGRPVSGTAAPVVIVVKRRRSGAPRQEADGAANPGAGQVTQSTRWSSRMAMLDTGSSACVARRKADLDLIPAGLLGLLHVQEFRTVPERLKAPFLNRMAFSLFELWEAEDEDFGTPDGAAGALWQRSLRPGEAVFVAYLAGQEEFVGTASIGVGDDYYRGFCAENRVHAGLVLRDLYVEPALRGQALDGLKAWQHLLVAALDWAGSRQAPALDAFLQKSNRHDILPHCIASGAKLAHDRLNHRSLAPGMISMVSFPVSTALPALLAARS